MRFLITGLVKTLAKISFLDGQYFVKRKHIKYRAQSSAGCTKFLVLLTYRSGDMSCSVIIVYGFLVLAICLFILACGNTAQYQNLRGICGSCPGVESKDPCFDFIRRKLNDKCRTLPQEIDMLNEHLTRVQELACVTREMYACVMPHMHALKCQLFSNAQEMARLPDWADMEKCFNRHSDNYGDSWNWSCCETSEDKVEPSCPLEYDPQPQSCSQQPLPQPICPRPSPQPPSSHCSLSNETDCDVQCPTGIDYYEDSAQQTAAIEQAVKFLCDCMKEGC